MHVLNLICVYGMGFKQGNETIKENMNLFYTNDSLVKLWGVVKTCVSFFRSSCLGSLTRRETTCHGNIFRPGDTRFMSFHALMERKMNIAPALIVFFRVRLRQIR